MQYLTVPPNALQTQCVSLHFLQQVSWNARPARPDPTNSTGVIVVVISSFIAESPAAPRTNSWGRGTDDFERSCPRGSDEANFAEQRQNLGGIACDTSICSAEATQDRSSAGKSTASRRRRRQRAAARAKTHATEGRLGEQCDCQGFGPAGGVAAAAPHDLQAPPAVPQQMRSTDFARLTEQLKAGGKERRQTVAFLRGSVWQFSLNPEGCRVVQLTLQVADKEDAERLLEELHGRVRKAVTSPHANFVIQTAIEVMSMESTRFVGRELAGMAVWTASHRFGCRILSRLIEHSSADDELIDEILGEVVLLCCNQFARHVVFSILEHGRTGHRRRVAAALATDVARYATDRNASHVVDWLITHGTPEDADLLAEGLLHSGGVADLAQHRFGLYVAKALIAKPGRRWSAEASKQVRAAAPWLQKTKYGSRIVRDRRIHSSVGQ